MENVRYIFCWLLRKNSKKESRRGTKEGSEFSNDFFIHKGPFMPSERQNKILKREKEGMLNEKSPQYFPVMHNFTETD